MGQYVAIECDGEVVIHLPDATGNYATMCGLDGNHPATGQLFVGVTAQTKINCRHCRSIWDTCKEFTKKDFA